MRWSLNEVETLAKKAVRGAGYSWGMAEEAAMAVRWLCERDVDGAAVLAQMLAQVDGKQVAYRAPELGRAVWRASSGTLCPLITGATLSDFAGSLPEDGIETEAMWQPVLLVPFAAVVARQQGKALAIKWDDTVATTDGDSLNVIGQVSSVASSVRVSPVSASLDGQPRRCRSKTSSQDWAVLTQIAHRTYAPATKESRMSGAGAGLCDND